jgi:PAS domain S-box-containing protein
MGPGPQEGTFHQPARGAEPRFDEITRVARRVLAVPAAVIAFYEEERLWIKSGPGVGAPDHPRASSLLGRLLDTNGGEPIEDLARHPLLAESPEVRTGGWRSAAAVPIHDPHGRAVGLLAVLDPEPRAFDPGTLELLADLAALVDGALRRTALEHWRRAALALDEARKSGTEGAEWLFEHSLDLMAIANLDQYFTQVSPSWTRLLGWSEAELLSRPYTDFVHPDDLLSTVEESGRLVDGSDTLIFRNRYRCRDGSYRWLHWKAHTSLERRAVFAVARDVTDARRAEEELRAAKESAEAANRAKNAFLASMSHELRTPLNAILGFTKILLRPEVEAMGIVERDYLQRVHRSGLHLVSLVNQVLDFNRAESGRFEVRSESVDVGEVVEGVLVQLEALAKDKGLNLSREVPADLAPIASDRGHLQQILFNLVGNALKFTERGSILVRVEVGPRGDLPGRLSVIDSGSGIPADQHARVFEPFVQLDSGPARRQGGTGLGLAIARSLCDALGYGLSVRSDVGEGSTFTVEFVTPPSPGESAVRQNQG